VKNLGALVLWRGLWRGRLRLGRRLLIIGNIFRRRQRIGIV
jgi:hypothetical protein